MSSFVTHLECANCQARYEADAVHGLCTRCHKPLWVRYDLAAIRSNVQREQLRERPCTMWRYRELSPVVNPEKIVSLGETMTPLLPAPRLASVLGVQQLYVKDESRLPTGSFKARGMAMAVTKAHEFGITRVATPTAGNAGGALSAYAARAGMQSYVFMPADTPSINVKQCWLNGAKAFRVNGLIDDCGRIVAAGKSIKHWFDLATLKEPYRLEGKKTMGLELAEQLGWELPDVILYPTGGGTGLIGMWKAFDELEALGWVQSSHRPRMISCQSDGCAPIAAAFERGERFAKRFENAATIASGVRVPAAVGDFMILDAVRASGGIALSVPESSIRTWMRQANALEGLPICPETAVCFSALETMLARGQIKPHERIVVFNTAAVQKSPEAIDEHIPQIDIRQPIDWEMI
jgi:threonine synthase